MTKPVITTRADKGAALTWTEGDTNLTNLRDATITVAGDSGSTATDLNGSVTIAGGTGLTTSVSGSTLTVNLDDTAVTAGSYTLASITVDSQGRITAASSGSGGGGGMTDIVQDTSPQLGGNLDVNGKQIVSASGGITIAPTAYENFSVVTTSGYGGGYVVFNGQRFPQSHGTTGQVLTDDGTGALYWASAGGGGISSVQADTSPQLGGNLNIGNYAVGSYHGEITTYGYNFLVQAKSGYNLSIKKGAGNNLFLNDQTWPSAGGSSGQVLTTDGSGNCSWSTPSSGGISSVQSDTSPQLGGNLNMNNHTIYGIAGVIDDGVTNFYQMQIRAQSGKNLNIKKGDGNGLYLNDQLWPNSNGSAGQVLTDDGNGNLSWATPSSGGNNIIMLSAERIQIPTAAGLNSDGWQVNPWTLLTSGGISGVSVNGGNGKFTLPAGTWVMEIPLLTAQYNQDWGLYDFTNTQEVFYSTNHFSFNSRYTRYSTTITFTTTGSTTLAFANQNSTSSNVNYWYQSYNMGYGNSLSAAIKTLIKITKVA